MTVFGDTIRGLRVRNRLTQRALGEAVGVGQGAVSKWEKGETDPGALMMTRLAVLFDVSVEQLLQGVNPRYDELHPIDRIPEKKPAVKLVLSGPLGEELARLWHNPHIGPAEHQTIVNVARGMISQPRHAGQGGKHKDRPSSRPRREG